MRWGFENLNLTEQRLEQLGMKGLLRPLKVTCDNHEGNGLAMVQQWDGKKWTIVSDWIEPMREIVRPKLEEAAVEEGGKLGTRSATARRKARNAQIPRGPAPAVPAT